MHNSTNSSSTHLLEVTTVGQSEGFLDVLPTTSQQVPHQVPSVLVGPLLLLDPPQALTQFARKDEVHRRHLIPTRHPRTHSLIPWDRPVETLKSLLIGLVHSDPRVTTGLLPRLLPKRLSSLKRLLFLITFDNCLGTGSLLDRGLSKVLFPLYPLCSIFALADEDHLGHCVRQFLLKGSYFHFPGSCESDAAFVTDYSFALDTALSFTTMSFVFVFGHFPLMDIAIYCIPSELARPPLLLDGINLSAV